MTTTGEELKHQQGDSEQNSLEELADEIKNAEANLIGCWRGLVCGSRFHFLTTLEAILIAVDVD